jgi:hypothetical protein
LPGRPNSQAPGRSAPSGLDAAEGHRPARLHGDLPEGDFAQLGHQPLDEIGLADRDAAAGDDGVGAAGGFAEGRFQRGRIVRTTPMSITSQPRRVSMPHSV